MPTSRELTIADPGSRPESPGARDIQVRADNRLSIDATWALANGVPAEVTGTVAVVPGGYMIEGHPTTAGAVRCSRCGRKLTNAISRAVGIGRYCCGVWGVPWATDESEAATAAVISRVSALTISTFVPRTALTAVAGVPPPIDGGSAFGASASGPRGRYGAFKAGIDPRKWR